MLYVSTREPKDAYTVRRALCAARAEDGGLYVPFRLPVLTEQEVSSLRNLPFDDCVAHILNLLFGCRLNKYDVDFAIGRASVRITALHHRILIGECWHNPERRFYATVSALAKRIHPDAVCDDGGWVQIGIQIAVLFGIFGELMRQGVASNKKKVDISVLSGDFTAPISAWYARAWGLPIGNIICCCNENNGIWDLVCQGQMRTDGIAVSTGIPEADVALPRSLERLIHSCGGCAEVDRYLAACRRGGIYYPNEAVLPRMRSGLCVSVVSTARVGDTMRNVANGHGYSLPACAALAYAGLQDHRARSEESRFALVMAFESPDHPMM